MEGTFDVRAPQETVFAFFLSPPQLSTCIDDPHTIEVVDDRSFKGTVKSGIGLIKGTFQWSAQVVERVPPERARIQVRGTGMGSAFDIDSTIVATESLGVTSVRWSADVAMRGTIASVGARLMQGTIDKKTAAFFDNARKRLEGA
ncbi:MAG: CoxG family protein [Methanobacteriota archaeon]